MLSFKSSKVLSVTVLLVGLISYFIISRQVKYDDYFITLAVNNQNHLCFMKKPGVSVNFNGEFATQSQPTGSNSKSFTCKVILPDDFRKKYNICILNGVTIDSSDLNGDVSLLAWSCHADQTVSSIWIEMKSGAKRGEVVCSMKCARNSIF